MKKILIATVAMLGVASYSFGQGEVLFSAGSLATTRIWSNTLSTVNGQSDGQLNGGPINQALGFWTFALYYAPSTVTNVVGHTPWLDPSWQFSGVYGTNTGVLGRMAGLTPGNANNAAVIPGYAAGETASLFVIAWNTAVGGVTVSEFASAFQSAGSSLWFGYSKIGQPQLGNGAAVPDIGLFGAGAGQISGFTIAPIPEPTTFALAGLGAAAMLIFRRRK